MKKVLLLTLLILLPLIAWAEAPTFFFDCDEAIDYRIEPAWRLSGEVSTPGTLTLEVGSTTALTREISADELAFTLAWDGLVEGAKLPSGMAEVTLRFTGADGAAAIPEMIALEVIAPSLATDTEYFTPGQMSGTTCGHDVCYWKMNMGEMNEQAIWQVLTQPVTVLEGDERKQVKIRREPSEGCEDYVGEVTCMSQAVHVLDQGEEWSLIEAYSSSVEGSSVKVWALPFQGYVKTGLLKERQVDQQVGLVIDKLQQRLYIFKEGKLFSTLLCSTGYPNNGAPWNETPAGEFLAVSWAGGFWSGQLYCDMGIRINDGILLHEVPCQVKVDELTGEEKRDYDRCERYLGEKASHGCIRIQRVKSPEGASIRWLWDNLSRKSSAPSKVIIWDELGRTLGYPDSDVTLYYNPRSGRSYHSSAWCRAVNDRYLPLTAFTYGEIEEKPYKSLTPCPACTPQRRMVEIDLINEENFR